MIKPKYSLVATTLILLSWAPHAGAGRPGSTPAPVIESAEIDPVQHRLTLTGNFFGGSTPVLTLGKHRLEVSESTPTQVVAKLPLHLRPATYRLLINNAKSSADATSLYLQIPWDSSAQVASSIDSPLK
jgi:hypothetical protein